MTSTLPPVALLVWMVCVVVDTGGQLAFKYAATDAIEGDGVARWRGMARRPWLWLGLSCYVVEFVAWLAFLSLVPLSDGVLLGSINIVAIMLAGRYLFKEQLSQLRVVGILLITAGVAIVGWT
ncbi:EamA family transporter [Pigmentiphaga litoralis]|uniref:Drug/metabolite transporter (DMT)-like permease n=1 Tax=Pigmentiphaga litoralis TaxID=516702 RepID=A0A7Y9IUN5_9BURK|nr:EamA family transporter [Pigmentiphaga litoralis]NYE23792.1 drug/metabolite transporter (DMT)-like permease [Pigmentiphaga litoralis]NYE82594.1 drug/metabolite transporter (DMT)-like permease [Pigmentiphaga litoralis]